MHACTNVWSIYILQVDSEFDAGRYEEARKASDNAKKINQIGITIGVAINIINAILLVIYVSVIAGASSSQLLTMVMLC